MLKRDSIFWCATGILALGFVLFAITGNQFWVALGIGSYLLRPTLASLGIARKNVDERQMTINYRSGNIGFAVLLITCVLYMAKLETEGNHDFELFATAIIIGLVTKALFNVILVKNYREAASKIITSAGLLIALFASLDGGSIVGALMQAWPGLAIAAVGVLSKKYPRSMAIAIFVLTSFMLFFVMTVGVRNSGSLSGQMIVAALIGVPLILAGICLFVGDKNNTDIESNETV
jgi:hypothetical protein